MWLSQWFFFLELHAILGHPVTFTVRKMRAQVQRLEQFYANSWETVTDRTDFAFTRAPNQACSRDQNREWRLIRIAEWLLLESSGWRSSTITRRFPLVEKERIIGWIRKIEHLLLREIFTNVSSKFSTSYETFLSNLLKIL